MWTRAELKDRAKQTLRKFYWIAFLVTLVAGILSGATMGAGASSHGPGLEYRFDGGNWHNYTDRLGFDMGAVQLGDPAVAAIIAAALFALTAATAAALIVAAFRTAYYVFIGNPLDVGVKRYFLDAGQGRSDFTTLFYTFKAGRYLNAVKAMAWRLLFTFLWSLLLIVPGIVKAYAYSMVPYLMADNPGMDYRRALTLSMQMTRGQKWEIFVLDLSFLGWALLGLLTCGIGFFFLSPYYQATKAELYVALRQKALAEGLCPANEVSQPLPTPVV